MSNNNLKKGDPCFVSRFASIWFMVTSETTENLEYICGEGNSLPHREQQAEQVDYRKAPWAMYNQQRHP